MCITAGWRDPMRSCFHASIDRKSTRLNSSHLGISYAVFCLKKKDNELTLAMMLLISFPADAVTRSWKGYDLDTMGRLHAAVLIHDPVCFFLTVGAPAEFFTFSNKASLQH